MAAERQKGRPGHFRARHPRAYDGHRRHLAARLHDGRYFGNRRQADRRGLGWDFHLKEFFLLLSSTGLAYRRCELAWVNGDQIGVNFLKQGDKKKKAMRRGAQDAEV